MIRTLLQTLSYAFQKSRSHFFPFLDQVQQVLIKTENLPIVSASQPRIIPPAFQHFCRPLCLPFQNTEFRQTKGVFQILTLNSPDILQNQTHLTYQILLFFFLCFILKAKAQILLLHSLKLLLFSVPAVFCRLSLHRNHHRIPDSHNPDSPQVFSLMETSGINLIRHLADSVLKILRAEALFGNFQEISLHSCLKLYISPGFCLYIQMIRTVFLHIFINARLCRNLQSYRLLGTQGHQKLLQLILAVQPSPKSVINSSCVKILHKRSFHKILIFKKTQRQIRIPLCQSGKVCRCFQTVQRLSCSSQIHGKRIGYFSLPAIGHKTKVTRYHIFTGKVPSVYFI